jgi:hypothetical protein
MITVNDIRKMFNKDKTEGGDIPFVTTNSQPIMNPKVNPMVEPEEPNQEANDASINTLENNDKDNGNT